MLTTSQAGALTGPQCLIVSEKGSVSEYESMLESHSVEQLYQVRDKSGRGLLHYAVKREPDKWRLLLDAGWPVQREKGWTPVHEATLLGKVEVVRALLVAGGSVSVKEGHNGGTPLHVAAFNGHFDIVKVLVNSGAGVNARDNEGWTPLSQARDQGFPEIVDWLKKHGASR